MIIYRFNEGGLETLTFSILARDPATGALGGAAATGNLCVGGWVLRGDSRAGLSASQGLAPSTLWGEDVLDAMRGGMSAGDAVAEVVEPDAGRETRQLAALDRQGGVAAFTGARNLPHAGHVAGEGWIVSGNWLASDQVIRAAADAFVSARGGFEDRLLAGLAQGLRAGSDRRGTMSAALLVVGADRPPLSLRVDLDDAPLDRLRALLERTRAPDYADWVATLPTRNEPEKAP